MGRDDGEDDGLLVGDEDGLLDGRRDGIEEMEGWEEGMVDVEG